jgi:hypothetical protein
VKPQNAIGDGQRCIRRNPIDVVWLYDGSIRHSFNRDGGFLRQILLEGI